MTTGREPTKLSIRRSRTVFHPGYWTCWWSPPSSTSLPLTTITQESIFPSLKVQLFVCAVFVHFEHNPSLSFPDEDEEPVSITTEGNGHGWDDTSPQKGDYIEGKSIRLKLTSVSKNTSSAGIYPDMRGIFIASGPAFKSGVIVDWIKLVDEYQIFLEVNYLLHPKMFWAKKYV